MAALTSLKAPLCRHAPLACILAGIVSRLVILAWGYARFEPVADGTYYHAHALRLADGLGYSWADADGTVRAVAHYPVGYPAILAGFYRVFGANPGSAMIANALVGCIATALFVRTAFALCGDQRRATIAALSFAIHPALVLYTPALMTEALTASLFAILFACFVGWMRSTSRLLRATWLFSFGVVGGVATLVRPQSFLVVLAFAIAALLLRARVSSRVLGALAMVSLTSIVVLPWTRRNCDVMGECAFVSMNDGWNLLIGTNPAANGSWAEVVVPDACVGVDGEAEVNRCFGEEATRRIADDPAAWLSLVPSKLSRTFDYAGAGPWYLHASNPDAFPYAAKVASGALETAWMRVVLGCALAALLRRALPNRARLATAAAVLLVVLPWATPAYLLFAYLALRGAARRADREGRPAVLVLGVAGAVIVLTALVHSVFFGSGRYALMVVPSASLGLLLGAGSRANPHDP